jgi:hypothetical protein
MLMGRGTRIECLLYHFIYAMYNINNTIYIDGLNIYTFRVI